MFGRKRNHTTQAPKHLASPAELHEMAIARIEEERARMRRVTQARFDAEGCPRYLYPVR